MITHVRRNKVIQELEIGDHQVFKSINAVKRHSRAKHHNGTLSVVDKLPPQPEIFDPSTKLNNEAAEDRNER